MFYLGHNFGLGRRGATNWYRLYLFLLFDYRHFIRANLL